MKQQSGQKSYFSSRILFIALNLKYVLSTLSYSWWCHQMEIFSASLALCMGNSQVTGEFPTQRPVTRSFDVFFDLRLNKRLSKQSRRRWFETQSRSLWRHGNVCEKVLLLQWPAYEQKPRWYIHPIWMRKPCMILETLFRIQFTKVWWRIFASVDWIIVGSMPKHCMKQNPVVANCIYFNTHSGICIEIWKFWIFEYLNISSAYWWSFWSGPNFLQKITNVTPGAWITEKRRWQNPWASYQILKLWVVHAPGVLGTFSPPPTSKKTAS